MADAMHSFPITDQFCILKELLLELNALQRCAQLLERYVRVYLLHISPGDDVLASFKASCLPTRLS